MPSSGRTYRQVYDLVDAVEDGLEQIRDALGPPEMMFPRNVEAVLVEVASAKKKLDEIAADVIRGMAPEN